MSFAWFCLAPLFAIVVALAVDRIVQPGVGAGIALTGSMPLNPVAAIVSALHLPADAITLISGIDPFMDMGRSAVNVLGNTVAARLVTRFGFCRRPIQPARS